MKTKWSYLLGAALSMCLSPAATVHFDITGVGTAPSGDAVLTLVFDLQDLGLLKNQELDIRFDPAVFRGLSDAVASSDFDVLLLQPNNPPGSFGDYSILALIDNPSLSGLFGVKAAIAGSVIPTSLPFYINEYDPVTFEFVRTINSGRSFKIGTLPEPSTLVLAGMAILGAACRRIRRS